MPSGRRSKPPETDSPVFFLDRSLGRVHIAVALRDRGLDVVLMAEFYPDGSDQRIPDDQWIAEVSVIGHVALTKDTNLIRNHRSALGEVDAPPLCHRHGQADRTGDGRAG